MSGSGRAGRMARTALRLAAAAAVAWASLVALHWVEAVSGAMPGPGGRLVYYGMIGLALLFYAGLLALPFVPGVEVGMMILAMQGPAAALPVYLATLAGLMLAFVAGQHLPSGWIAAALRDAGLRRAGGLVAEVGALAPDDRLTLLRARMPARVGTLVVGWRYPLLALLLNLPGNWLLGGGGGLMVIAGLTRIFRTAPVLLTVALAVAPVPLLIWALDLHLIGGATG